MARAKQVRRKSRRQKKSNWGKILGFSALGLVVFLLVAGMGMYFWVKSFLRSEEFRAVLEEKTGDAMKGKGTFEPLEWTGASAYTNSLEVSGFEDAWFSEAKAEGIRVDINVGASLRRGIWEVARVAIDRVSIKIDEDRLMGFHPGVDDQRKSFLDSLLPQGFELVDSKVQRFFFNFKGGKEVRLDDARIQAKPWDGGGLAITGTDGRLVISELPNFDVQNFSAKVDEEALTIDDMALSFYDGASLTGRGKVVFRQKEKPGRFDINYKVRNLDVKNIVGDDWLRKLSGNVRGDFSVEGDDHAVVHRGKLVLDKGVLEALGVLDKLADYLKTSQYRKLVLDGAEMSYTFRDDKLEVERIYLLANGLLQIEGRAVVKDGNIDGEFYLGISPEKLKWLPGAHKRVFTVERSGPDYAGYAWTVVEVSGPMESPSENLSARLMTAMGMSILVDAPSEAIEAVTGKGPGEALENAPGVIKDGVEAGTGLLESGVKAAKDFLPMFGN